MYENELKQLLEKEGATEVGFCKLNDAPYPYAVSILVKLSDAVLSEIDGKPTMPYFQHYRAVNALLDRIALFATAFIEEKGYLAFPVAASQSTGEYRGYFPHKTAAVRAGLGYIGRSCLLISEKYGSKIRLATVLTDMPMQSDRKILPFSCGECQACVRACPAGAISGKAWSEGIGREELFDAEKCSHYMKNFRDIGRGSVCGLCIKACPKNGLGTKK